MTSRCTRSQVNAVYHAELLQIASLLTPAASERAESGDSEEVCELDPDHRPGPETDT